MNDIILMLCIENNENNLNNQQGVYENKRLYEDECLLCIKTWRKNAGWLKDIPIYVICPTENTPSLNTINKIRNMNAIYIPEYMEETKDFLCGYWNIPLVGKWCEENLDFNTMIHIDDDMTIIKALPETLVNYHKPICGIYDIDSTKDQRVLPKYWSRPFDTGFTISRKDSKFYETFYNVLTELTKNPDDLWKEISKTRPFQDLEEYAMDKIYNEKLMDIEYIERYQIGEGYASINTYNDEELKNIYFWHEHILYSKNYNKIQEKVTYLKRMRIFN